MELNPNAPVIYSERIVINAPLPKVWEILSDIPNWPAWNPEVKYARLQGKLAPGTTFVWKAGGVKITSTLETVEVSRTTALISWRGKTWGIRAVHTYTLRAQGDTTLLRTGESFDGPLPRLLRRYLQTVLAKTVHHNLAYLQDAAERLGVADSQQ